LRSVVYAIRSDWVWVQLGGRHSGRCWRERIYRSARQGDRSTGACQRDVLRASSPWTGRSGNAFPPAGEVYVAMVYAAPWSVPMVATRFVTELDNARVVHDWELYRAAPWGAFPGSVQAVIGNEIEQAFFASWNSGDPPLEMPPGVGLELPPPNSMLTVHWHYVSFTPNATDASAVKICAVPAGTLAHTARRHGARDRKRLCICRIAGDKLLHELFFRTRHRLSIASPHVPARRQSAVSRAS
jgi:hypothetical protein